MIRINKAAISRAAKITDSVATSGSNVPVYQYVHIVSDIDSLTMTACSQGKAIMSRTKIPADVSSPIDVMVPAGIFARVLAAADAEEIELIPGDDGLHMKDGDDETIVVKSAIHDFPSWPQQPDEWSDVVDGELNTIIASITYASSPDKDRVLETSMDLKPGMAGAGTNQNIVSIQTSSSIPQCAIPVATAKILYSTGVCKEDVRVGIRGDFLHVTAPNTDVVVLTTTKTLPGWQKLFSDAMPVNAAASMKTVPLLSAVRRIAGLTGLDGSVSIEMGDEAVLSAEGLTESIDAIITKPFTIVVGAKPITQFLQRVGEDVVLELAANGGLLRIRSGAMTAAFLARRL